MNIIPNVPVDNKLVLFQVIAWCRTGDKPLPELMLTMMFYYAILRYQVTVLTHWGRVTHIRVGLTTIGSDSGLSFGRHKAII